MPIRIAHKQAEVFPSLPAITADLFKRERLEDNQTSSLADPDFANFRTATLTPEMINQLKNWDYRLNLSKYSIEQHFEKRVSHLFIQAVICYRTGYRFRAGHTIHQALGAHHLHVSGKNIKFEAAHSPTIPCLYAYSEETQQEHVFLYRSGVYDEGNATIDLLKAVNDADSEIDWLDPANSLREKTIELLNKASKGEMTPVEVSKAFALELIEVIDQRIDRTKKDEAKDVLKLYRDKAELLWSYVDHPENIDRWLNLDLEDPLLTVSINRLNAGAPMSRDEVLQLVKAKIEQLPVIIHQERHQAKNESRSPAHFYDLFFLRVFKKFNATDTRLIEEATGMHSQTLRRKAAVFQRTRTSNDLLDQNAEKIAALAADLQPLLARLKGQDNNSPATTLAEQKKVSLRPGVYRLRYQMIRADQEAQSKIKTKIESIWHQIQNTGSTAYLETFFHKALLDKAPSEKVRLMFCKLLSISGADIAQRVQEIKVNRNAHTALEKYSSHISRLAGRIQQLPPQATAPAKAQVKRAIQALLQQIKSSSNAQSIDILFYKRLFNFVDTSAKKGLIAELIGKTEQNINQAIAVKSKTPAVETKIQQQDGRIQEILGVVDSALQILREETQEFRRGLMVELRLSHGMSQNHLKDIYRQRFAHFPMSDGTMSNLENGAKTITETIISQFASIFGVNADLFHPAHFADEMG